MVGMIVDADGDVGESEAIPDRMRQDARSGRGG
jgi:hypothetical protein